MIPSDPQKLWQATLADLEGQMTRATYDTWLRDSTCTGWNSNDHTLVVAVKNSYAIEWLSARLY